MRSINSDFQFPVNFHKFSYEKLIEKNSFIKKKFLCTAFFVLILINNWISLSRILPSTTIVNLLNK